MGRANVNNTHIVIISIRLFPHFFCRSSQIVIGLRSLSRES